MEIRKLMTFVDVAETLNYTETAGRLYTTQATVSKQIKSLEQELGVELIDRTHRVISLTPAGALSLPYAQRIVAEAEAMQAALRDQQAQQEKRLVLRAIPSIAQYKGFNMIAAFSRQHPDIDLQFAEAETKTLLPALDRGQADVIFTRLFAQADARYDVLAGETDHFVALLPAHHPKAAAAQVSVTDLADDPLLLLSESTGLYAPVLAMLERASLHPQISYTGQRIDLIAGMVNRGMGVAIMMAHAVALEEYTNVRAVPLTPRVTSQLAFMRLHGHHSVAIDAFWEFCQKHS